MILRADPGGLVVISQPAHALFAGRLAEVWGSEEFGGFEPWREVCFAAAYHDLGWLAWEEAPTLNPHTGRPHAFDELDAATHLAIWARGPQQAAALGRYVALLISLHSTGLYDMNADYGVTPTKNGGEFIEAQRKFQETLLASLRADAHYASVSTPEAVKRNRSIVRVCDALSLYASLGSNKIRKIDGVPTIDEAVTITMEPDPGDSGKIRLKPWPFCKSELSFALEGRRLPESFTSEISMRSALSQAPWATIEIRFIPG